MTEKQEIRIECLRHACNIVSSNCQLDKSWLDLKKILEVAEQLYKWAAKE